MLNNATIGQFFPGNSFLYKLDPRTKLLLTIALIVIVFVAKGFIGLGLMFLFVIVCTLSTGIGVKYMVRALKPLLVIIGITFVLNLFLMKDGEVLVKFYFIQITTGGLNTALFMALRLILLIQSTQILTLTTSPLALTDALESLMRPLEKLRFPAHEISMMMSIALRFIPTLMEETEKIRRAQMARGADFESGGLLARIKAMLPLLVPLFVSAFRRADELALAMEARCYRGGENRTKMKQLRFTVSDVLAFVFMSIMIAAIILLNRFLPM